MKSAPGPTSTVGQRDCFLLTLVMGACPVVPGGGLFCVVVFVVVLIDFRERGREKE